MKQQIYKSNAGNFEAEELLPCPFCGRIPEVNFIGNDHTKIRKVEIRCSNVACRAKVRTAGIKADSKQVALWSIEKWNRRIN